MLDSPQLPPLPATSRADFTFRRGVHGLSVSAAHLHLVNEWTPGRTIVGTLPFDHRDGSSDLLYASDIPLQWGSLTTGAQHDRLSKGVYATEVNVGIKESFIKAVDTALATMATPESKLAKVVLARAVHATLGEIPDWESLLRRLSARNRNAWVFSVPLGEDRSFLGASPELLLRRRGRRIASHPLAGSVPRSADPVEDRRRAESLSRSAKDHHEHSFVVDMIAETLRPWCSDLDIPQRPELLATDKMWHLGTLISGELISATAPGSDALSLVRALHPTPAVAGAPTHIAMNRIHDWEQVDRRYFAGTTGWCDDAGDGDWVVSIRSAEFCGDHVTAWAGAGIVEGSDSELEYAETGAKLRTILEGLGIVPMLPETLPAPFPEILSETLPHS